MKKLLYIFIVLLFPIIVFSQNVEVEGGLIADSIDVSSGKIKNVANPADAQDAATKAYVDLLEATIDGLQAQVDVMFSYLNLFVQDKLDLGLTPKQIYDSDNSLLDSLYGKTYQGGLIAYLNTSTGTGLVAAPLDQSAGAEWGCYGDGIGGTSTIIGAGQANTTLIVNGCAESGIAAKLCDELDYDGYNDWFLPSKDELNELRENLYENGFGDLFSGHYWSSSEDISFFAWVQYFFNSSQFSFNKDSAFNVRAVRAF